MSMLPREKQPVAKLILRDLEDGPATVKELKTVLGLCECNTRYYLRVLHKKKLIYIGGWEQRTGPALPVWYLGSKKDKPRPPRKYVRRPGSYGIYQMKFYLLWNEATNRLVIDRSKDLKGYVVQKETTASCWIDAKRKFGFELTPLQQEMLNEKNNSAQAGRRFVRHLQDAGAELRATNSSMQDRIEAGEDTGDDMQQVLREEGALPSFC